jgi:hypothetical protein
MRSKVLNVVIGVLLTLGIAETTLRLLENQLPPSTHWPTVETDFKFRRLIEMSETDVVFLGSSITEAGIDPVAFAAESKLDSAFNSGLPFSTPYSNEWWLNQVVLRHVEPKLVVIGLTAWSGGASAGDDLLLPSLESAITSAGEPPLALLRHAGVLSEWDSRATDARGKALLTDLGHQTGYYDRSIDQATPLDLPFDGPPEMPDEEADAVGRMIGRLTSSGIEVIVLIEPGRYPGDDRRFDYDRYVDSIIDHHDEWGVPVVDAFHQPWDRALYADLAHFNRRGTEEFTSYLARTIDGLWANLPGKPGRDAADIA